MAKVRLMRFEIAAMLNESKGIIEHLQKCGYAHLENVSDEELLKYDTSEIVSGLEAEYTRAEKAVKALEKTCEIKRGLIETFTDFKTLSYDRYKVLAEKNEETYKIIGKVLATEDLICEKQESILHKKMLVEYLKPWKKLDILMASKRTLSTRIFIGSFNSNLTEEKIHNLINEHNGEIDDYTIEVISNDKLFTGAVIVCYNSSADTLEETLRSIGFKFIENPPMQLPSKLIEQTEIEISELKNEISALKKSVCEHIDYYDDIRFLCDWITAQIDKYKAVELTATSQSCSCSTNRQSCKAYDGDNRYACKDTSPTA